MCFLVGEMDSGIKRVKEWQQTTYGLDSGIQSGATTIRDDDGEYTTTRYVKTTTVTREEPGEMKPILRLTSFCENVSRLV